MRKIVALSVVLLLSLPSFAQQQRHFRFRYAFTARNIPAGAKIEIWFPRAQSDAFQHVKILSVSGDLPLQKSREPKFGDTMFHASAPRTARQEYRFAVEYEVIRRERVALPHPGRAPHLLPASANQTAEYLGPDALVPVTGKLAQIAAEQVRGISGVRARARALYDYVFRTMRYDKTGAGWGRGDAEWACASKRGNCTDFHSVFIAMARSQGIPARFEIGFPLPFNRAAGEIAGYHCWAEFYDPQYGWAPVDISEAWQDPLKQDYLFGALDANRVQLSLGRDLRLNPPQAGPPLNYFVYPYVEVNGKQWQDVANQFSFADAVARAATVAGIR